MRLVDLVRAATLGAAAALIVSSQASGASVIWTINTSATSISVSGTGQAPISGSTAQLRIIAQGSNPGPGGTPTLPALISGRLITDTDFTSSIKFLKTGAVEGETTGNWKPDLAGNNIAVAGDIGGTIQTRIGSIYTDSGDVTLRDLQYDLSSDSAAPIVGGSFSTNQLALQVIQGNFDYRGYNLGALLGSGRIEFASRLRGDANWNGTVDGADYTVWADNFLLDGFKLVSRGDFNTDGKVNGADYTAWADHFLQTAAPSGFVAVDQGGDGTITQVGSNYQLTIPIQSVLRFQLAEDIEDLYFDLKLSGHIVATTPVPTASLAAVPEPTSAVLAGLGLAILIVRGLRTRFMKRDSETCG